MSTSQKITDFDQKKIMKTFVNFLGQSSICGGGFILTNVNFVGWTHFHFLETIDSFPDKI